MTPSPLTRPLRVVRARARGLRDRRRHAAEVRSGSALTARADRTPIFIVGAPRSGTTVLYQLLVEGLDVGWLANAHMTRPAEVARVEREQRPRAARRPSTWESTYGATREPWEPHEAEPFWYRFLPREPHELDRDDVPPSRRGELRAAVRAFMDACERPAVFKNVYHSLRLPVLADALPEARFVLIERDVAETARSILVGRERLGGSSDTWLSARPRGAEAVTGLTPAQQAVWQVRQMDRVARRELERLGEDRWTTVDYARMVADPRGELERLQAWLVSGGAEVVLRPEAQVPARFSTPAPKPLPADVEAQLAEAVAGA